MSATYDAIVIGAGINGMVCAARLAAAGFRTLVLERAETPGGGAATREIAPGFHAPVYAHQCGPFRQDVADALALDAHGVAFTGGDIDFTALAQDGRAIVVYEDDERTAAGLATTSPRDAGRWRAFARTRRALGDVVASLFTAPPPPIDGVTGRDLWQLLRTIRKFRALPKADQYRLLRWGPMPAADLIGETVESDLLAAGLAGDAVFGTMLGPRSAGSGMALLLAAANGALGVAGGRFVQGGPGRLAAGVAAALRAAGADLRTNTEVTGVVIARDRAAGVRLATGEQVASDIVISAIDPRRTFLSLVDPVHLGPEFVWRIRNFRARGTLAKVNLALAGLPAFAGAPPELLAGRVRLGAGLDTLERAFDHAKYGRFSPEPWVELTLPTVQEPSLAPAGAHVLSAYVQWAPYELRGSTWDAARDALGDAVVGHLERFAPGLSRLVIAREVLTPLDLERQLGLTGGHIFHGELALD
ncbi:MAG: phytoene desaturase family protein, partial [Vicinamibacterales bacterium]